jgi:sugar diacid utilization regulator
MTAGEAVDLYLATVGRAWEAPAGEGEKHPTGPGVLDAVRAAVPVLAEGYQTAGRALIRQEETERLEFIDDLLRGDADVAGLVQRAEPFGLDLSAGHQVVLAGRRGRAQVDERDAAGLDRALVERYGDRDVLVAVKGGYLVGLVPAAAEGSDVDEPARWVHGELRRTSRRSSWRVSVGRPAAGAFGAARSYREAREAMVLTERLHPDADMVPTPDLLIYRVLGRDRVALADLVHTVLTPLEAARGGSQPLVDTLEAYFATGEVTTEAARRLHVSVRTVTYRLARIRTLTGYDPAVPIQRLTLQAAVIGARLLRWPGTPDQ